MVMRYRSGGVGHFDTRHFVRHHIQAEPDPGDEVDAPLDEGMVRDLTEAELDDLHRSILADSAREDQEAEDSAQEESASESEEEDASEEDDDDAVAAVEGGLGAEDGDECGVDILEQEGYAEFWTWNQIFFFGPSTQSQIYLFIPIFLYT